jgi:hypothetical protein
VALTPEGDCVLELSSNASDDDCEQINDLASFNIPLD